MYRYFKIYIPVASKKERIWTCWIQSFCETIFLFFCFIYIKRIRIWKSNKTSKIIYCTQYETTNESIKSTGTVHQYLNHLLFTCLILPVRFFFQLNNDLSQKKKRIILKRDDISRKDILCSLGFLWAHNLENF